MNKKDYKKIVKMIKKNTLYSNIERNCPKTNTIRLDSFVKDLSDYCEREENTRRLKALEKGNQIEDKNFNKTKFLKDCGVA